MLLSQVQKVNFNGKVNTDSIKQYSALKDAAEKSPFLKLFAGQLSDDLYVHVKCRNTSKLERVQLGQDDVIYRMFFSFKKPAKSVFGKIFNFMFSPSISLTSHFHSEPTLIRLLLSDDHLKRVFKDYTKFLR